MKNAARIELLTQDYNLLASSGEYPVTARLIKERIEILQASETDIEKLFLISTRIVANGGAGLTDIVQLREVLNGFGQTGTES